MSDRVEGVAIGMKTVPVEELEARRSAVFNGLSLVMAMAQWPEGVNIVTQKDLAIARAISGELAWVHEWLAELVREHREWIESLRG